MIAIVGGVFAVVILAYCLVVLKFVQRLPEREDF
jgi:hypothetical protein